MREAMVAGGSRMIVIGHAEFTTDIPEYADFEPKDYWDRRARGLGGSATDPVCSCAEENLLAFPGDPYHAENILIAYLPAEGIIFEADHFPQPATGVIPPAVPATVAFGKALERLGLEYDRIVGAHSSRVATPADLERALTRPVAERAGGELSLSP